MTQIMIANSDPDKRRSLARLLSSNGYDALTASNGTQAVLSALSDAPEIIIADRSLPQMDGLELCRSVRGREGIGYIYVILLGAGEKVVEGLQAGADDYLAEPFNEDEMLARVRSGRRIVELHRDNEQLRIAAATDELTGLLNRRGGFERVREHWASATRHSMPLACMLVDIDGFKAFNDAHGHETGDTVLRHTAKILCEFSRADEPVCRWGGEEFLVLCPRATVRTALDGAGRLVREVAERPLGGMRITISAGAAERGHDMKLPEEMIKAADGALYAAKEAGKNRARKADPGV